MLRSEEQLSRFVHFPRYHVVDAIRLHAFGHKEVMVRIFKTVHHVLHYVEFDRFELGIVGKEEFFYAGVHPSYFRLDVEA